MKELDLYKFIQDTGTQISWRDNELIVWIHPNDIIDFAEMVGSNYLSDEGIECNLRQYGYIAFDITALCEHYNIDPERILEKYDSEITS